MITVGYTSNWSHLRQTRVILWTLLRISTVLLLSILLVATDGFAQIPAPTESVMPTSFIDYVPDPTEFAGVLQPAVEPLLAGIERERKEQKAEAKKKFTEGLQITDRLLKKLNRGHHDELYHLRGFALEHLGQPKEALNSYRRSLDLKTNNPAVLFRHAYLLKSLDRCEEAVPEFKEIVWLTRQNTHEALYLTAECLLALERKEEALKLTNEAYRNNPRFLPVLRRLVATREEMIADAKNPVEKAQAEAQLVRDLTLIVEQDPADRDSTLKLGRLLLKQNDPLVSAALWEKTELMAAPFVEQSGFEDEESVKLLFDAQIKQGKIDEANTTLRKGLAKRPESSLLRTALKQLEIEQSLAKGEDAEEQ